MRSGLPKLVAQFDEAIGEFARFVAGGLADASEVRSCAYRAPPGGDGASSPRSGWGFTSLFRGSSTALAARDAALLSETRGADLQQLLVRACSLWYALERLGSLEGMLAPMLKVIARTRSEGTMVEPTTPSDAGAGGGGSGGANFGAAVEALNAANAAGGGAGSSPPPPLCRFAASRPALVAGFSTLCDLLGAKIVAVDARMHESLYSPRVREAPLRLRLKDINLALGAVVRCAARPKLREAIVAAILRECVASVEHVLLRPTAPPQLPPLQDESDVQQLREDAVLLRDFFLAKDPQGVPQGMPAHRVDEACRPLHQLLVLLSTPSELLVRMWESASDEMAAGGGEGTGAPAGSVLHAAEGSGGGNGGGASSSSGGGSGDGGAAAYPWGAGAQPRGLSDKQRIEQLLSQRTDDPARRFSAARQQEKTRAATPRRNTASTAPPSRHQSSVD